MGHGLGGGGEASEEGDFGGAVAFLAETIPGVGEFEFGAGEVFEDEDAVWGEGILESGGAEEFGGEVAFAR